VKRGGENIVSQAWFRGNWMISVEHRCFWGGCPHRLLLLLFLLFYLKSLALFFGFFGLAFGFILPGALVFRHDVAIRFLTPRAGKEKPPGVLA
jgi:hypothetical protein